MGPQGQCAVGPQEHFALVPQVSYEEVPEEVHELEHAEVASCPCLDSFKLVAHGLSGLSLWRTDREPA